MIKLELVVVVSAVSFVLWLIIISMDDDYK